jgi:hypothetical protein
MASTGSLAIIPDRSHMSHVDCPDLFVAVLAAGETRRAGFDHGSEDYEAALRYLLDWGYLRSTPAVGGEGFAITTAGKARFSEGSQDRPTTPL